MHNTHNMNGTNHYLVMFIIMIFSGLLSTMNIYADKLSDIRLSLNDLYMTLLMTGWMFAFMGIFYKNIRFIESKVYSTEQFQSPVGVDAADFFACWEQFQRVCGEQPSIPFDPPYPTADA